MRFALVALALVGCHHAPATSTPTNKVPAPDYSKTAEDELGFLPADADFVVGLDMVKLRQSPLWQKYEPHIVAFAKEQLGKMGAMCGDDPQLMVRQIERAGLAIKLLGRDAFRGVAVIRGFDAGKTLECAASESQKQGGTVTRDRGVIVTSNPKTPQVQVAMSAAAPMTSVTQFDQTANHDTLTQILVAGSPLRSSQAFMTLYNRREPGAAVWGMANGNAKMFDELAQMGMRPKSIDGTLIVTDAFTVAVRLTMTTPDEAAKLTAELDKVKGGASAFLQRFDYTVNGPMVQINVVMTEEQMKNILGMLGGMGP